MKELVIEAKPENLDKVLSFVDQSMDEFGSSQKAKMQMDIAVEEIFINIANYAYRPETGYAFIHLETSDDPTTVTVTFKDTGMPYDPLAKPDPDITLSAEERQIGGLGIFMAKKSVDDIRYEYKNGENILSISKKL